MKTSQDTNQPPNPFPKRYHKALISAMHQNTNNTFDSDIKQFPLAIITNITSKPWTGA
jgi:hypothetical protein